MRTHLKPLALVVICLAALVSPALSDRPLAAAAPTARPGGRRPLDRSSQAHRRADAAAHRREDVPGAVSLVARNGRIAHFETHGLMDLETKKPMQKDAIFRIMSMTKPVVGVAILMLVEDGKVRLTDPVSKFIPDLQGLSVVVLNTEGRVAPAPSGTFAAPMPGPHGSRGSRGHRPRSADAHVGPDERRRERGAALRTSCRRRGRPWPR